MRPVAVDRRGEVLVITIDRPSARNAIDPDAAGGIAAALDRLDDDAALVCGVLTGANGVFSAGMDLKAFAAGRRPVVEGRGFAGIVERPPVKPLIAAVEGFALGGGFEIALACDLIVAADDAWFALPEVSRGLVAAGGGLLRLPRRIPYHAAMELALTGRRLDAARAHALGLVTRLAPSGGALDAALELAGDIAGNSPAAILASKQILSAALDWRAEEAFDRQAPIADAVRSGPDAGEGARAFAERRAPVWQRA